VTRLVGVTLGEMDEEEDRESTLEPD